MAELSLNIWLNRLPRAKCAGCRRRRVLYVIEVRPLFENWATGSGVASLARCAKCLGIGK